MGLREDILPVIDLVRGVIAGVDLSLRPTRVYVRLRQWSGGEKGLGTRTDTDTEITPRPEVIEAGGGKLTVTAITPSDGTIGWTPAQLQPAMAAGRDFFFIVVMPDGNQRRYRLDSINLLGLFNYTLTLSPFDRSEPEYDN